MTNVKQNLNGNLIIKCDTQHTANIKRQLENQVQQNFQISEPKKRLPQIKIHNIETWNTEDQIFINNTLLQNNLNESRSEADNEKHFKIIKKRIKQNDTTIVVETSPYLFKKIMDKGELYIGWRKCYINETFSVKKCYKCSGYGHLSNKCTKNVNICPHCAENHTIKECSKTNLKCTNCELSNKHKKTNLNILHSSMDNQCPTYQLEVQKVRNMTDYKTQDQNTPTISIATMN